MTCLAVIPLSKAGYRLVLVMVATTRFGNAYSTRISCLSSARYIFDEVYAKTFILVSTMRNFSLLALEEDSLTV